MKGRLTKNGWSAFKTVTLFFLLLFFGDHRLFYFLGDLRTGSSFRFHQEDREHQKDRGDYFGCEQENLFDKTQPSPTSSEPICEHVDKYIDHFSDNIGEDNDEEESPKLEIRGGLTLHLIEL